MKALKYIALFFALVIAAAVIAFTVYSSAPSEAEQCEHLVSLLEKKLPGFAASPPGAEFKTSCPAKVAKRELEGQLPYAKRARCLMAADSMEAVEACD